MPAYDCVLLTTYNLLVMILRRLGGECAKKKTRDVEERSREARYKNATHFVLMVGRQAEQMMLDFSHPSTDFE